MAQARPDPLKEARRREEASREREAEVERLKREVAQLHHDLADDDWDTDPDFLNERTSRGVEISRALTHLEGANKLLGADPTESVEQLSINRGTQPSPAVPAPAAPEAEPVAPKAEPAAPKAEPAAPKVDDVYTRPSGGEFLTAAANARLRRRNSTRSLAFCSRATRSNAPALRGSCKCASS